MLRSAMRGLGDVDFEPRPGFRRLCELSRTPESVSASGSSPFGAMSRRRRDRITRSRQLPCRLAIARALGQNVLP